MFKIKKKVIIISFVAISLFILAHIFCFIMADQYIIGRDTVKSFGDGRYQIIRIPITTDEKSEERNLLYDLKEHITIESEIYVFQHDEEKKKVYIIGSNGYTVLKYNEERYRQSKALQDFSDEEQSILLSCGYNLITK